VNKCSIFGCSAPHLGRSGRNNLEIAGCLPVPENPEILLIISEKFQNNTQYLFKQETMMIKNCWSKTEFAIININKEERKSIF